MRDWTDLELKRDLVESPHPGGGYYWPPEECVAIGRKISTPEETWDKDQYNDATSRSLFDQWHHLSTQVAPDEVMFGIFERRLFGKQELQAVQVSDIFRMSEFELQVRSGSITRVEYVAIKKELASAGLLRDVGDPYE